ncbi:MAG: ABC transporter permease [Dictyoglomus sp. NZ13-RE01]|nr:MAG: ABC transporter permease [Dictyoglomus sp. NZ13-RE01]
MKIIEAFKSAFYVLRTSKLRSFLTILGIIIGVFTVILLISIGQGAKNRVTQVMENLGTNTLIIFPSAVETQGDFNSFRNSSRASRGIPKPFTYDDLKYLKLLFKDDLLVSTSVNLSLDIKYKFVEISGSIVGTDMDGLIISREGLLAGRFFTDSEIEGREKVCIIGPKIAIDIAGSFKDAIGKELNIGGQNYRVIGVLKEKGISSNMNDLDRRIIIPLTLALTLRGSQNINFIAIEVKRGEELESFRQRLILILKQRRGRTNFVIAKQEDLLSAMNEILNILTLTLAGIAGVSLIVGGIGIMNIMLVSVMERIKEIGIRKAVGARKKDILIQFLIESSILGILGGLIGIFLALIAGNILKNFDIPFSINLNIIILGFLFSFFVGLVFGVVPAVRAGNLDPIQALRSE